ncbi:MAG: hypothetical protein PUC65_05315 [Clostridiales bacterium]|nr:hypothetical protein [Clostridiales bacterium]
MFHKKSKVNNEVFGEVKRWELGWTPSAHVQFELWNQTYELGIEIVDPDNDSISKCQEDAYIKFKEKLEEFEKAVEQAASDYLDTQDTNVLKSMFKPYDLQISLNGECILMVDDTEQEEMDDQEGLAVFLFPKIAIFPGEQYRDYVLGGGDEDIRRELYE